MNSQDCFKLGHISKAHGIKGEVVIALDVDDTARYKKLESVFIEINQQLVPFFIKSTTIKNTNAIVLIDGINTIEQTSMLIHASVFLPLSLLPKLDEKKFYFHEVIGFTVVDKIHGNIGVIENILEYPGQRIIQIKDENKNEILIPIRDEFISKVDRTNKCLNVSTPEGLIDVYLKKENNSDEEE